MSRKRAAAILRRTAPTANGCIVWTGTIGTNGYGYYRTGTRNLLAHRFVWETMIGPCPEGREAHHTCENARCVNPVHLKWLTKADHWRLGNSPSAMRARQTHCKNNHKFTRENTYITARGHRRCRICHRTNERNRQRRAV